MALSTEQLLRKAILTVGDGEHGDFGAASGGYAGRSMAPLSIEQVSSFIELMSAGQVLLNDVRRVTSNAAKWQESIIDFSSRIARPGVEANRLGYTQRAEPTTGMVEINTSLIRAEVPVSDEVFEDNVAGSGLLNTLERLIADRFGYDIEDLFVNGDLTSSDSLLALFDGWMVLAEQGSNVIDASTYSQDYQEIFRVMLESMPQRFLRNLETAGRFYVPKRLEIKWRDILSARGTDLGDIMLTNRQDLQYQGIKIVGVPVFESADPTAAKILLANANNLYAGFHRAMRFETYRDPREGVTSFIVTARVGAAVAIPEATVVATDVNIEV